MADIKYALCYLLVRFTIVTLRYSEHLYIPIEQSHPASQGSAPFVFSRGIHDGSFHCSSNSLLQCIGYSVSRHNLHSWHIRSIVSLYSCSVSTPISSTRTVYYMLFRPSWKLANHSYKVISSLSV